MRWRGNGTAFASSDCHLDCTLVAWWGDGHAEPWFVLTGLPPDGCDAQWYGMRGWCEQLPTRLVPEPWPDIPERLEATIPQRKALSYASM